MSRPAAEVIRKGMSALRALERGEGPNDRLLIAAIEAMAATMAQHRGTGQRDLVARAAANKARLVRTLAGLPNRADPGATLRAALAAATEARDLAIAAAKAGGVNDDNLAAYVIATDEAAQAALDLGQADPGAAGTAHLDQAAAWFGEAEAGYRRLGQQNEARAAALRAVEARGRRALRGQDIATGGE
jgi:hypothetical protein